MRGLSGLVGDRDLSGAQAELALAEGRGGSVDRSAAFMMAGVADRRVPVAGVTPLRPAEMRLAALLYRWGP